MSGSFVSGLRARDTTIRMAPDGANAITIRVEMPEVWDTVRIVVSPEESVFAVKERALEALFPEELLPAAFVLKFRGWEILDESVTLAGAEILDNSILLLTHRRRRAVR